MTTAIVDQQSSSISTTKDINPNAKYIVPNTNTKNNPKHLKNKQTIEKKCKETAKNTSTNKKSKKKSPNPSSSTKAKTRRDEQRAKAKAVAKAQEKADDEEIAKFVGKKPITNKNGKVTKSNSSYYLYHSTSKEEAEKYKPKKVLINHTNHNTNTNTNRSTSAWNTGATMEEFDYSEWAKTRITELLLSTPFSNAHDIHFSEVTKIEGTATVLYTRGKFRPGYDFMFEVKWCGNINGKDVCGTLCMDEITSEDDSEDWEFEVKIKKKSKGNKTGAKIISQNRENVINSLQIFISELKAKKS